MRISATIVTLNEERNIARAIESLKSIGDIEIVVVDSGSSDRTREVAAESGARVIDERWRGYAAQKNYAAAEASHNWILSLDADEALTPELASEIEAVRRSGEPPSVAGYSMPRLARYLGRWIRHSGWYPDRKIRLYDRRRGSWAGEYVHETVQVQGPVANLKGDLLHYTCASLSEHLATLDRYTTLAASELAAKKGPAPMRRLIADPAWMLFRTWVIQQGFRDGPEGAAIAWMAALYTFLKYAKARELTKL